MLTENEVGQLLQIPDVQEVVEELHQTFTEEEIEFKEISQHDFLSGMLMLPSVALAMVDGTTSLSEELTLNKKARRFSKGGFFLRQDPVVKLVNHMQSQFNQWESRLFDGLGKILKVVIPEFSIGQNNKEAISSGGEFLAVMNSSYISIKLIETFFLPEGEEIISKRHISLLEHQTMVEIVESLQLSDIGSFRNFIKSFEVK